MKKDEKIDKSVIDKHKAAKKPSKITWSKAAKRHKSTVPSPESSPPLDPAVKQELEGIIEESLQRFVLQNRLRGVREVKHL